MTFPILGGNGAVAGAFSIDNSLRFNDDDSAYLSRTPSSAGNRKTFTWSGWVKRSSVDSSGYLFTAKQDANNRFDFGWYGSGILFNFVQSGSTQLYVRPLALFRDPSAWYHLLFSIDTTNATASDRFKIYVNGVRVTDFVGGSEFENNFSQNDDTVVNTTNPHAIGANTDAGTPFDGYMADVHFIDGQALSPTDFGEFDEDSGIWKPIRYSGSYGTNGFYLDFENSGSLGADSSGNGNDLTPTNLASTDQMIDTPTNNFATLNPLVAVSPIPTLSQGNLESTPSGNGNHTTGATIVMPEGSGKWYAETVLTYVSNQSGAFTIQNPNNIKDSIASYSGQYSVLWQASGTDYYATHDGSSATNSTNATISVGDIFQIAYDSDNGKVWFGRNNTWITGNPSTDTTPTYSSITGDKVITTTGYRVTSGSSYTAQLVNFGQDSSFAGNKTAQNNSDANGFGDFYYAPPSGYLALCTQNLATELSPTIDDGSQYFNTLTWSGDNTTRSFTGLGFSPDWVWIKCRSDGAGQVVYDSVRGNGKELQTHNSDAELTNPQFGYVSSFDSDGFTTTPGTYSGYESGNVNMSGRTYVGWSWRASDSSAVSNTDGTNASTVSVNQTAGFSIVSYTRDGNSTTTVGHGLGKTPKVKIEKDRDTGSTNWSFITSATGSDQYGFLNTTDAFGSTTSGFTSTVFNSAMGANQGDIIAYVFAEIEGYSKISSYTGNGNADGTFVYTGFKPKYLLQRRTNASGQGWTIQNSDNQSYNEINNYLFAQSSGGTFTGYAQIDFLSNGFKIRRSDAQTNGSGDTYIYMAFAENPFVDSNGVPVTAR